MEETRELVAMVSWKRADIVRRVCGAGGENRAMKEAKLEVAEEDTGVMEES